MRRPTCIRVLGRSVGLTGGPAHCSHPLYMRLLQLFARRARKLHEPRSQNLPSRLSR